MSRARSTMQSEQAHKRSSCQTDGAIHRGWNLLRDAFADDLSGPFSAELRDAQRDIILSRTLVLIWISVVVMPTAILPYVSLVHPTQFKTAAVIVGSAMVAVFVLRTMVLRGLFDRHCHGSMLLLVGGVFGPTGTAVIEVTRGGDGNFFFAFFLIYFAFTALYPATVRWVLATSVLLMLEWTAGHFLGGGAGFGEQRFAENIIYLLELTFIGIVLNRVVTQLFFSERTAQFQLRLAQSQQLQSAHKISNAIQKTQGVDSTLQGLAHELIQALPSIGDVEVSIDFESDGVRMHKQVGAVTDGSHPSIQRSLHARNETVGTLKIWPKHDSDTDELIVAIDFLMPTLSMAVENALNFDEIDRYKGDLEKRVQERTEELSDAKDKLSTSLTGLQDAEAARDRIFANLNHELRTPLSIMRLATEEIASSLAGPSLPLVSQPLEMIDRNVSRLLNLVNGLLILASHDEGKLELHSSRMDLRDLVRDTSHAWKPLCTEHGITLVYDELESAELRIDELSMERVLSNLLSNAIKYTPEGGSIAVRLRATAESCVLTVQDTGVGMPAAFASQAFDRFSLGPAPVRHMLGRSGIGLSLVRELIEAQEGRVALESSEGHGTTVTITMPMRAQHVGQEASQPTATPSTTQSFPKKHKVASREQALDSAPTILIAEDEDELRESMARALGRHYRIITARNGVEALAKAKEHGPDLLVTDIEMPEMNGIELTRAFADQAVGRVAPTLIVTARSDLDRRIAGFDAGAVDFISKPFHQSELLARVDAQLRIRELLFKLLETEKLASIGYLGAGMAHEFRNPVNIIVNAIDALEGFIPEDVKAGSASLLLAALARSSQRLRNMCDAVLALETPRNVTRTRMPIRPLLQVAASRDYAGELIVQCDAKLEAPVSRIVVMQVLQCLVDNAIKICGSQGRIEVSARIEGEYLSIRVADNGPGIRADLRERVFAPFFTTAEVGEGTGLGLALARKLASEQGATLRVLGSDIGCTMELRLPISNSDTVSTAGTLDLAPARSAPTNP